MKKTTSFALAASFAASAAAQAPARPHPADSRAETAARPYESALRDYRSYAEPEVGRWREANQEVGRLGGHQGHARKEPESAGPASKAPVRRHHHHGGHK